MLIVLHETGAPFIWLSSVLLKIKLKGEQHFPTISFFSQSFKYSHIYRYACMYPNALCIKVCQIVNAIKCMLLFRTHIAKKNFFTRHAFFVTARPIARCWDLSYASHMIVLAKFCTTYLSQPRN